MITYGIIMSLNCSNVCFPINIMANWIVNSIKQLLYSHPVSTSERLTIVLIYYVWMSTIK